MASPTIRDVASRLGLSISTISKALNDYGDISEGTRERVRAVAQEMGYLPNASARALKLKRTYNLGVLFCDENMNGFLHPYYCRVLDGFRSAAQELGFDITLINHNMGSRELSFSDHCKYRGVEGICVACVDFYRSEVLNLSESGLPIVAIDQSLTCVPNVISANRQSMCELVGYAISRGHRDIAYIHGQAAPITWERLAGMQNTMLSHGIPVRPEWVIPSVYLSGRNAYEKTLQLLALPQRPGCILYADDTCALHGISAIRSAGLRVPEDISVAGFGGMDYTQLIHPKLTTVYQDAKSIGVEAAHMLIGRIERPFTTLIEDKIIAGSLLRGETIAERAE